MVSSWKAAETGIVQVPRSCDGSVRAARPLAISPWATLNLYALVAWSVLIQINGPFFSCERRGKEARSMGTT